MNSPIHRRPSEARSLVEAAAWRSHLTEIGAETTAEFEAWLACADVNQKAWQQVQAPWELLAEHANCAELIELRRAALGHARRSQRGGWLQRTLRDRVGVLRGLAAALLLATVGAAVFWGIGRPATYETATGERRVVTLNDGSQISLDSRSEVRVAYSANSRELELVRGQARFDVVHDVQRPFSVLAGGQKVVATGTAFNIDLFGPDLLVTLIEGRVVVFSGAQAASTGERSAAPAAGQQLELSAGEQLVVSARAGRRIAPASIERTTAWQTGQLVFADEPLSSVIERVNRYLPHPIRVADAATAAVRISGVFNIGDAQGFVGTITHYLPIQASEGDGGSIDLKGK